MFVVFSAAVTGFYVFFKSHICRENLVRPGFSFYLFSFSLFQQVLIKIHPPSEEFKHYKFSRFCL